MMISRDINLLVSACVVYVRCILEYNSIVWFPHLKQDIDAVERVQRQRRFTKRLRGFGNYSCNERLRPVADWPHRTTGGPPLSATSGAPSVPSN